LCLVPEWTARVFGTWLLTGLSDQDSRLQLLAVVARRTHGTHPRAARSSRILSASILVLEPRTTFHTLTTSIVQRKPAALLCFGDRTTQSTQHSNRRKRQACRSLAQVHVANIILGRMRPQSFISPAHPTRFARITSIGIGTCHR